ncbi:MAG: ribonuclease J [Mariprofundaceae bacterium]
MSHKTLRLYPFGGVGEFGKNMMVYAWGEDAVIVDCGMGFPGPGQHGVDVVIPDISALNSLGLKLHAILLTHGHEDHIGGLPYLLPQLKLPLYGTAMTLALIKSKLEETNYKGDLNPLPEEGKIDVGPFAVEAVPVTHSIMDAVSIVLHTPLGAIVHTGDFKFDPAPIDGRPTALHRFASLGDQGVLLLASDSTNATRPGSSPSERSVGPALKQVILDCPGKVIVTTFASNMFRLQQIIDVAMACGRKVALAGRSLERNVEISRALDRLNVSDKQLVSIKKAGDLPPNQLLVLATGSQGESRAALARIAHDRFTGLKLATDDLVVFSSSMIPGNERIISSLFNHIYRRGARIVHAGQAPIHVSGHAQAHELKTMLQLTRPKYFYPVHGEYRNLIEHSHLASATGMAKSSMVIAENGQSVEINDEGIHLGATFDAGAVFVDGAHRDEIDHAVLHDRRKLAEDGIVTAMVIICEHNGQLIGEPELAARGVLHQECGKEVLAQAAHDLAGHLTNMDQEFLADVDAASEEIRIWLRRWFKRQIGRRPIVIPQLMEI